MPEKITKRFVDTIPFAESGQRLFYDPELVGFGLRVTKGAKSYFVEKRISGKSIRTTIGRHGPITPDMARKKAQELLGSMTMGVNPVTERRESRAKSVTLEQVYEEFLSARKSLKPRTVADYRSNLIRIFPDWLNKPIRDISKDMVARRHALIGQERGPAQANLACRYLRSIINFAIGKYEDAHGNAVIQENPVRRLSQARAWFKIERRRTFIKDSELKPWLDAVDSLRAERAASAKTAEVVPDYLEFLLLTGLRRNEAARIQWRDVDLDSKTFTIDDTKNHQPLTLPMSDRVWEILSRRQKVKVKDMAYHLLANNSGANQKVEYVFPGGSKAGFLVEPKRQLKKISARSGLKVTLHDLRRTFATVAESLDIGGYTLKRLLNHKQAWDVTAGYIVHDVERLRGPMQRITDAILTRAGRKGGADIIPFAKAGGMQG